MPPIVFAALPKEIYLELAKFLSPHELKLLGETCALLRVVFCPESWRVCQALIEDENRNPRRQDDRSEKHWTTRPRYTPKFHRDISRGVPLSILCEPHKYRWFKPEWVVHLDLGHDYENVPLDAYPALQSVHVTLSLSGMNEDEASDEWDRERDPYVQFMERTTCDPRLARIARISIAYLDLAAHLRIPVIGLQTTTRVTELRGIRIWYSQSSQPAGVPFVLQHVTTLRFSLYSSLMSQLVENLSKWESLVSVTMTDGVLRVLRNRPVSNDWITHVAKIPQTVRHVSLTVFVTDILRDEDNFTVLSTPVILSAVTTVILNNPPDMEVPAEFLKFPRLKCLQMDKTAPPKSQAQLLETFAKCSDSLTRVEIHFNMICHDGTILGLRKLEQLKRLRIAYERNRAFFYVEVDLDSEIKRNICAVLDAISRNVPLSDHSGDNKELEKMLKMAATDPCMALALCPSWVADVPVAMQEHHLILRTVLILEAIFDTVLNYLPALEHLAVHYDLTYLTSPALTQLLTATLSDAPPQTVAALRQIQLVALTCKTAAAAQFARLPAYPAMLRSLFLDQASALYDIKERSPFERYYSQTDDGVVKFDFELSKEEESEMMTDEFDGWVY